MAFPDPGVTALEALAVYNVVQNLLVPDRAYVPANLAVAAGLVTFARRQDMTFGDLGLGSESLRSGLRWGGAVGGALGVAILAAGSSPRFDRWLLDDRARGHSPGEAVYLCLVRFPLGTALFEEVAFRGVLDGLLRRASGANTARVATATWFGLWHIIPTWRAYPQMGSGSRSVTGRASATAAGVAVTALSGLGFTGLRERSGSVAAPWLAHAAINAASYLAARRAWRSAGV